MSDRLFFALAFGISIAIGYLNLFHTYKVQGVMLYLRNKHLIFRLWIPKWAAVSPYYILILRIVGVGAWLYALVALFGLMYPLHPR